MGARRYFPARVSPPTTTHGPRRTPKPARALPPAAVASAGPLIGQAGAGHHRGKGRAATWATAGPPQGNGRVMERARGRGPGAGGPGSGARVNAAPATARLILGRGDGCPGSGRPPRAPPRQARAGPATEAAGGPPWRWWDSSGGGQGVDPAPNPARRLPPATARATPGHGRLPGPLIWQARAGPPPRQRPVRRLGDGRSATGVSGRWWRGPGARTPPRRSRERCPRPRRGRSSVGPLDGQARAGPPPGWWDGGGQGRGGARLCRVGFAYV